MTPRSDHADTQPMQLAHHVEATVLKKPRLTRVLRSALHFTLPGHFEAVLGLAGDQSYVRREDQRELKAAFKQDAGKGKKRKATANLKWLEKARSFVNNRRAKKVKATRRPAAKQASKKATRRPDANAKTLAAPAPVPALEPAAEPACQAAVPEDM